MHSMEDINPNDKRIVLRVDCYPRDQTECICQALQLAALDSAVFSGFDRQTITDPYEGPLNMTASATKCTHRLTIIRCQQDGEENSDLDSSCSYFWGLADRCSTGSLTEIKLNHQANEDICIVPAANPSLENIQANTDPTAPLSRAYYKLHQVWQDHFYWPKGSAIGGISSGDVHQWLEDKVGMDVGASPGGWTQVLVHCAKLRHVVALDAGRLAARVLELPQVVHVPRTVESVLASSCHMEDALPTSSGTVAYSVLVCDASVRWSTLLEVLLLPLARKVAWTMPALVVVTMKLPFKSNSSIQRHIDGIEELLPTFMKEMSAAMYPDCPTTVATRCQLVHLMANTDQERTLIAHFGI